MFKVLFNARHVQPDCYLYAVALTFIPPSRHHTDHLVCLTEYDQTEITVVIEG